MTNHHERQLTQPSADSSRSNDINDPEEAITEDIPDDDSSERERKELERKEREALSYFRNALIKDFERGTPEDARQVLEMIIKNRVLFQIAKNNINRIIKDHEGIFNQNVLEALYIRLDELFKDGDTETALAFIDLYPAENHSVLLDNCQFYIKLCFQRAITNHTLNAFLEPFRRQDAKRTWFNRFLQKNSILIDSYPTGSDDSRGVDLKGVDLRRVDLSYADLRDAKFNVDTEIERYYRIASHHDAGVSDEAKIVIDGKKMHGEIDQNGNRLGGIDQMSSTEIANDRKQLLTLYQNSITRGADNDLTTELANKMQISSAEQKAAIISALRRPDLDDSTALKQVLVQLDDGVKQEAVFEQAASQAFARLLERVNEGVEVAQIDDVAQALGLSQEIKLKSIGQVLDRLSRSDGEVDVIAAHRISEYYKMPLLKGVLHNQELEINAPDGQEYRGDDLFPTEKMVENILTHEEAGRVRAAIYEGVFSWPSLRTKQEQQIKAQELIQHIYGDAEDNPGLIGVFYEVRDNTYKIKQQLAKLVKDELGKKVSEAEYANTLYDVLFEDIVYQESMLCSHLNYFLNPTKIQELVSNPDNVTDFYKNIAEFKDRFRKIEKDYTDLLARASSEDSMPASEQHEASTVEMEVAQTLDAAKVELYNDVIRDKYPAAELPTDVNNGQQSIWDHIERVLRSDNEPQSSAEDMIAWHRTELADPVKVKESKKITDCLSQLLDDIDNKQKVKDIVEDLVPILNLNDKAIQFYIVEPLRNAIAEMGAITNHSKINRFETIATTIEAVAGLLNPSWYFAGRAIHRSIKHGATRVYDHFRSKQEQEQEQGTVNMTEREKLKKLAYQLVAQTVQGRIEEGLAISDPEPTDSNVKKIVTDRVVRVSRSNIDKIEDNIELTAEEKAKIGATMGLYRIIATNHLLVNEKIVKLKTPEFIKEWYGERLDHVVSSMALATVLGYNTAVNPSSVFGFTNIIAWEELGGLAARHINRIEEVNLKTAQQLKSADIVGNDKRSKKLFLQTLTQLADKSWVSAHPFEAVELAKERDRIQQGLMEMGDNGLASLKAIEEERVEAWNKYVEKHENAEKVSFISRAIGASIGAGIGAFIWLRSHRTS